MVSADTQFILDFPGKDSRAFTNVNSFGEEGLRVRGAVLLSRFLCCAHAELGRRLRVFPFLEEKQQKAISRKKPGFCFCSGCPHRFPIAHFSIHPFSFRPSGSGPALLTPPPQTGFLQAPASGSEVTAGWPPASHPAIEVLKEQFPLPSE